MTGPETLGSGPKKTRHRAREFKCQERGIQGTSPKWGHVALLIWHFCVSEKKSPPLGKHRCSPVGALLWGAEHPCGWTFMARTYRGQSTWQPWVQGCYVSLTLLWVSFQVAFCGLQMCPTYELSSKQTLLDRWDCLQRPRLHCFWGMKERPTKKGA